MLPLGMLPWVAVIMTAFLKRTSVGEGAGESWARAARPIAVTATRQSKMLAGLRETRRRNMNAPIRKRVRLGWNKRRAILATVMRDRNEILVIRRERRGQEQTHPFAKGAKGWGTLRGSGQSLTVCLFDEGADGVDDGRGAL